MADAPQSYEHHTQIVPMFHIVTFGLFVVTLIGSLVNLYQSVGDHSRLYSAALLVALIVGTIFTFFLARVFALKVQDRAIRAEEQLRHFVMTGTLLDSRLTIRQIIGLRFASDGEFVALAKTAAEQGLSERDIKKAVKAWRADTYRV